jgi:uncharacterized protein (TIGR04222 family)
MSLGPFDLTGGPFLALYVFLLAVAVVAGFVMPRRLRPPGRRQKVTDVDQLAFLAGGPRRFNEAVVSRLLATRSLTMIGRSRFRANAPARAASPAEGRVLALASPIRWKAVASALRSYSRSVDRNLVASGLVMSRQDRFAVRFWALLPYLMLLAFGATKWVIGNARDRPIGYLSALLIVTMMLAIVRWVTIDLRTEAGTVALAEARRRSGRLKIAPTTPETDLAVALFGTAVLAGSGWSDFHRLRKSEASTCGGGCSGGGGGCGGGGCGGCGG